MNKKELIMALCPKIKLIRIEFGYTQEQMAELLGISKKTLVQIEKGRIEANWGVIVCLCALFGKSEILEQTVGGEPISLIETISHGNVYEKKEKTMGGQIWWSTILEKEDFKIQKNIISKHYRILDYENYRLFSSFSENDTKLKLKQLIGGVENE